MSSEATATCGREKAFPWLALNAYYRYQIGQVLPLLKQARDTRANQLRSLVGAYEAQERKRASQSRLQEHADSRARLFQQHAHTRKERRANR
jgi:hypothetical protein